jgi:hypothetical protein
MLSLDRADQDLQIVEILPEERLDALAETGDSARDELRQGIAAVTVS